MMAFTLFHVTLSLIGIAAGFVVIWGFLSAQRSPGWNAIFLAATILTSVTGFFFPIEHFTPAHAVGILSLLALGVAVVARYPMQMGGRWRAAFVVTSLISQYFNFSVLIIQSFQKVPALKALVPTQSELPFVITQLIALTVFIALGVAALSRFRHESVAEQETPAKASA